jgi:putative ABC transport system permease protein
MLKNYLSVAYRNIVRNKGYSFINIAGLAIGMACCVYIFLWISQQYSFDKFNKNADQIYLVPTHMKYGENTYTTFGTVPMLGPTLKAEMPEVVNSVRIQYYNGKVKYGDKAFRQYLTIADGSYLQMFTFPLISGDPKTALSEPYTLVLSRPMAEKYFGTSNPIGEIISVDDKYDFTVTGVADDIPENSSFQFDFLTSMDFGYELWGRKYFDTWYNCSFTTLIQLDKNADVAAVEKKVENRINESWSESNLEPFLFPLVDLHLHSISGSGGRIESVRLFSWIALAILLIACMNFVNMSTARSYTRAKEVGVRKVIGAGRMVLIRQFIFESVLYALIAAVAAMILIELLGPIISRYIGIGQDIEYGFKIVFLSTLAVALVTGFISGAVPALFLSGFMPVQTIKGFFGTGSGFIWFRRVLVVVQFALSLILIIGTVVIYEQGKYMQNKDLGYNKDKLVYVPMDESLNKNYDALKTELLKNRDISYVTRSTHTLSGVGWNGGSWSWPGKDPSQEILITYIGVDYDFLQTFGMKMAEGNFYVEEKQGSAQSGVVINETLARFIGKGPVVGTTISQGDENYTILGVVKDFNYGAVRSKVGPLMMLLQPNRSNWYLFARISGNNASGTIEDIKSECMKFSPEGIFGCYYQSDLIGGLYRSEEYLRNLIGIFSFLAILVSCLGLFGLAAFSAAQRTREIGIRKVLGATVGGIFRLITREFIVLIVVANFIAWPLAYYITTGWLEDFAYRINLGPQIFLVSGVAALVIGILTVGYQAIKAALSSPVEAIKYE